MNSRHKSPTQQRVANEIEIAEAANSQATDANTYKNNPATAKDRWLYWQNQIEQAQIKNGDINQFSQAVEDYRVAQGYGVQADCIYSSGTEKSSPSYWVYSDA